jgi:hypothetical protein
MTRNHHEITRMVGEETPHRSVGYAYKVGGWAPVPERVAVLKNVARKTAVARWAVRQKPRSPGDVLRIRGSFQPRVHVSAERSDELLRDAVFEPSCQIVSVLFGGIVFVEIVLEKDVVLHTVQPHHTEGWIHACEYGFFAFYMISKGGGDIARLSDEVGAAFATEHVDPPHRNVYHDYQLVIENIFLS